MWIDLNKAGDFAFDGVYDVCVCGSGPAGITTARRLKDAGARVLLLEAGGLEFSEQSQSVYRGRSVGPKEYFGVESCRLRYFGGTSNHWTGMCTRFDEIDFEDRGVWSLPGWPISFEDVYQYEDEARTIADIDFKPFDRREEPRWHSERMRTARVVLSPPTRFGEKFHDELSTADNLDVALNANVVDLRLNDAGRAVREIVVAGYGGKEYAVRATYVILAFGALENARFLLNARNDRENGLGNQNDLVGRCFMDHLNITLGRFSSLGAALWEDGVHQNLNPTPEVLRARGAGNSLITVQPQAELKFYGRLAPFRRAMRNLTCSTDFLLDAARKREDILCSGDGEITTILEQSPDLSSRVLLDDGATDQFGRTRLKLDWRINDQDRKTIRALAEEIGMALAAQDAGRVRIADDILDNDPALGIHCHHMGTTRMASSAKYGVVDGDCKVYGVDNLYIGGSSVYPISGGCNPTFTIVCLSLRLGDHLARRLGKA